jgi:hypothetical protein
MARLVREHLLRIKRVGLCIISAVQHDGRRHRERRNEREKGQENGGQARVHLES